jgi:hypothetical protein
MMMKHSILFAVAILLTAVLSDGSEDGAIIITTILVPLWYVTSVMIDRRKKGRPSDCSDYI